MLKVCPRLLINVTIEINAYHGRLLYKYKKQFTTEGQKNG
jgi:hypothetical protein